MRVPNRCWVTQRSGGALFHRERRVVARAVGDAAGGDYGEAYCGLKLSGDRRRLNELPMHRQSEVCRPCQQGYMNDAFPLLAFAR